MTMKPSKRIEHIYDQYVNTPAENYKFPGSIEINTNEDDYPFLKIAALKEYKT